jgi:hypothetical protein
LVVSTGWGELVVGGIGTVAKQVGGQLQLDKRKNFCFSNKLKEKISNVFTIKKYF